MKVLIYAAMSVALVFGSTALAKNAGSEKMKTCAADWDAMKAKGQTHGESYRDFTKACMHGDAAPAAPAGATAKCRDGTYSMAKSHSGACSHHGGVANWLK